jgi:hypothetical protein
MRNCLRECQPYGHPREHGESEADNKLARRRRNGGAASHQTKEQTKMSDQTKLRKSEWLEKINNDHKRIVDAVRNLENCIGYCEMVRHCGDSDEPTMTTRKADRYVRLARGRLFVVLYTELTGEQISK